MYDAMGINPAQAWIDWHPVCDWPEWERRDIRNGIVSPPTAEVAELLRMAQGWTAGISYLSLYYRFGSFLMSLTGREMLADEKKLCCHS